MIGADGWEWFWHVAEALAFVLWFFYWYNQRGTRADISTLFSLNRKTNARVDGVKSTAELNSERIKAMDRDITELREVPQDIAGLKADNKNIVVQLSRIEAALVRLEQRP